MNKSEQPPRHETRKILESPVLGSLVVPIAIIVVGALIIFGVTKMLSTDRSYKDLVNELHSKTFGNRWIAAYELSKQISNKRIPAEDVPWLVSNLSDVYSEAVDPRTRDFIIVALGALKNELALPLILKGLEDKDPNVKFHSMVALGNMPENFQIDWDRVIQKMRETKDEGVLQAGILAVATHRVPEARKELVTYLTSDSAAIRYAAALGLINFKDEKAIPVLQEILLTKVEMKPREEGKFDANQMIGLKLNIMAALQKNDWKKLNDTLSKLANEEDNKKVAVKAQEVLNLLKN